VVVLGGWGWGGGGGLILGIGWDWGREFCHGGGGCRAEWHGRGAGV